MALNNSTSSSSNGQHQPQPPGFFKDELDDFERFALDKLVRESWGLKEATLNRLIYCGVSVDCLEVLEERDLDDVFNDERMIGQKILIRHRLREWRKGLHWNSPEIPTVVKRRHDRRSLDPFEVEKKPRLSMTNGNNGIHSVISTPLIMLPDARQSLNATASTSNSPPSALTNGNGGASSSSSSSNSNISDAGNLPIRITPEALSNFLQNSRSGRWVVNYFTEHHRLDKKALTELTHVVVEPFLIYNITFTHALMRHYAEVIVHLFPSEHPETFYCPRNTIRKNPTGKLYDRYVNQRLRYKTKFNAQRPTMVEEGQLHRTFAEMSTVGDVLMQQQYLEFAAEQFHKQRLEFGGTPPQMGNFGEESINVYGSEEGTSIL